jgi:hypothetical protein
MAFQMNYTNVKGANYPQSYWRIGSYQMDRTGEKARVRFDCYFDEAARENNIQINILEFKTYMIEGADFVSVFETSGDIRQATYDYAKACIEGPIPPEGDPDMRVSFFDTATNV